MVMGGGTWKRTDKSRFGGTFDKYRKNEGGGTGTDSARGSTGTNRHFQRKNVRQPDGTWGYANWRNTGGEILKKIITWDVAPKQEYFEELFRISRNQIIWGGNYFDLPPTRCFLIWRKTNIPEQFSMAMVEYAWTSFNDNAKMFEFSAAGQPGRFHPTQKPVQLYNWILNNYSKRGGQDTRHTRWFSFITCCLPRTWFQVCRIRNRRGLLRTGKEAARCG
jgi:site-specific DNA-methyltransferase (adenine-specific)